MGFPISKTTTAVEMKKSAMSLNHAVWEDGKSYVFYSQGYTFLDGNGNAVRELQKENTVSGMVSFESLQANNPGILEALTVIWEFLDSKIREQEELD